MEDSRRGGRSLSLAALKGESGEGDGVLVKGTCHRPDAQTEGRRGGRKVGATASLRSLIHTSEVHKGSRVFSFNLRSLCESLWNDRRQYIGYLQRVRLCVSIRWIVPSS